MAILSKEEFGTLASMRQPVCVSVFIPTHREGQPVLNQVDALVLKNKLKEIKDQLEKEGMPQLKIRQFLSPIESLVKDSGFWRGHLGGLAIFLADRFFKTYALPIRFAEFYYVGNSFYTKPLLPVFSGDGPYFILSLDLEHIRFYRASRYSIQEISVKHLVPSKLEEVVGYDYEQKSVQFHSVPQGGKKGVFHGHGEGKDDRKEEIKRFLKAVDKGLTTILHQEKAPLVLACQDFYFPIYQSVTVYPHLFPKHLTGDHPQNAPNWLHEKAWDLVQPYFDQDRKNYLDRFFQFQDTPKASSDIREIVPAAVAGKIEALFVNNQTDLWGQYAPAGNKVTIEENPRASSVSLLDLAAEHTLLNRGMAYLFSSEEIPEMKKPAFAIFRYGN
ncbi:MAG: hypothetical protein IPI11_17610 [Haliscomenobacter sp.]|nr:hypothetical protein [Haliscomenobacter sp.]